MKTVTLKRKDVKSWGRSLIVPNGIVVIDENGLSEMDEDLADLLLAKTNDWESIDTEGDVDGEDEETLEDKLNSMSLKELIELALESQIEKEEVDKFSKSKKLMISFLIKKLK